MVAVEQAGLAGLEGEGWLDADGQAGIDSDKCQIHMEQSRAGQGRDIENIGSSPLLPDLSALLRKKNIK